MEKLDLTPAQEIQFMYPEEPTWEEVNDAVLIDLVEGYRYEQNCATSALYELKMRQHPRTSQLAKDLLSERYADRWLRDAARHIISAY